MAPLVDAAEIEHAIDSIQERTEQRLNALEFYLAINPEGRSTESSCPPACSTAPQGQE